MEFFETVDLKKINKKTLDSLIKSGAFDGFSYSRMEIFENTDKFIHYALKRTEDLNSGQQSLFRDSMEKEDQVKISETGAWSYKERLAYEKESFGFYLNDHPMKSLEGLEHSLNCETISRLKQMKGALRTVRTLAMVSKYQGSCHKKEGETNGFCFTGG